MWESDLVQFAQEDGHSIRVGIAHVHCHLCNWEAGVHLAPHSGFSANILQQHDTVGSQFMLVLTPSDRSMKPWASCSRAKAFRLPDTLLSREMMSPDLVSTCS